MEQGNASVHTGETLLLGLVAAAWVITAIRLLRGLRRIPHLSQVKPLPDAESPTVSILVTARDEAAKLPYALPTWVSQQYPRYEIIVANDRSRDATPQILEEFARQHPHLKTVHLDELPPGWLGKPHGLAKAYEKSAGEWLVFTDADVRFGPDLLRYAVALAHSRGWDHLTLLGPVDLKGFWENVAGTYWGLSFILWLEPWRVRDPRSKRYMGTGMFQLLRRSVYDAIGTHRRLALEVVDDIKLGKLVKQAGFSSGVALADGRLRIRWQEGLANFARGLTKNAFAATGFSLVRVSLHLGGMILTSVYPFLAVWTTTGLPRTLAGIGVVAALALHAAAARATLASPLYALTHPLGGLIVAYVLLRSTVVTLWRGGIVWRDTFYPLEDLKRGMV